MTFERLSNYLQKLENTSSRLEITRILAELFKKTSAEEIDKVCYLILGSLAPGYRGIVFNIAEKLMLQIIARATGVDIDKVRVEYKKVGDMGEVVYSLSSSLSTRRNIDIKESIAYSLQTTAGQDKLTTGSNRISNIKYRISNVSVGVIYEILLKVATDEGEGSVERKIDEMANLLSNLDPLSTKYIVRITMGKLRLGFSDKTVLDALSWMETGGKDKKKLLESAYNVLPDVGLLAKKVKEMGIDMASKNITPIVGVPLLPALAQRLKSPAEMIKKMGEVSIEPKYDGLRIQIHYRKSSSSSLSTRKTTDYSPQTTAKHDEETKKRRNEETNFTIKAFTRNLNECSWMFPELQNLEKFIDADEIILDTEAVGVDEKRQQMVNFQTTMTRRRKYDIEETSKKVSIKFYVFDCMFINGQSLIDKSYLQRRKILTESVKDSNMMEITNTVLTDKPEVIEKEMKKKLSDGMEGIVVKKTDSKYMAGRTGFRWVKMKEQEGSQAKLADTIDCVVMGYYKGRGKRSGFGLGGFLVGLQGKESILTLTKIGTGITDEKFRQLYKRLGKIEAKEKPSEYGIVEKVLIPDVWVTPSLVVEIAADEITKSPNHSSGYALRFPRLVKIRDDKSVEQATTLEEMKKIKIG